MAQSLSAEEFGRIQEQIIELRTLNYELESQNQRQESEIKNLQEQLKSQEKELQKNQKIISKSKQKKEFSLLLEENESLQRQFQSQEENFKLQNQTLLLEITRLNEENDSFKKDFEKLHKTGSQENSGSDAEIIRLKAENAVLQKSLANAQEKYSKELLDLQNKNVPKNSENNQKTDEDENSPSESSTKSNNETNSNSTNDNTDDKLQNILNEHFNDLINNIKTFWSEDIEKNSEKPSEDNSIGATEAESSTKVDEIALEIESLKDRLTQVLDPLISSGSLKGSENNKTSNECEAKVLSLENQLKEMSGLQLRLDTELEEKHLLQEQLQQRELQEEKEKSYSENRKAVDDLKNKMDNEIRILAEQITKLQEESGLANQRYFELQEESSQTIKELQNSIVTHQSKATTNAEENEQLAMQLRQEKDSMLKELDGLNKKLLMNAQEAEEAADLISRLEEKLQSSETRYIETNGRLDEIREQLKDEHATVDDLNEQVKTLTEERVKLVASYDETSKLAEKRKSTLDQMAIERQDIDRTHREQIDKIHDNHKKTMTELTEQLTGEKKLKKENDDLQQKLADSKTRLQASEEKCSWFERTLARTEEAATAEKEQNKKITEDLIEKHNQDMAKLNEDKEKQLQEMTCEIDELNSRVDQQAEQHDAEIEEQNVKISKLTQELQDKVVENRIAGKKGDQLVKDLKRQYKLERKRADQLQQKLQEALSENRAKQNFDELFSTPSQRRNSTDSSILSPNRSDVDSPDIRPPSPTSSTISGLLNEDTTDLIERLADVQQEKWLLEEKVRHLEETGGALADDLMQKSHIIQTYAMKTKIGPINEPLKAPTMSSLKERMKSSLNIGKNKADTKKIQMMLEETLMKNVQLQEDIDRLSKELQKYTKDNIQSSQSNTSISDNEAQQSQDINHVT